MIRFADLSISRKLLTGSLLTTGTALVVALGAGFIFQIHLTRQTAIRDLTVAAQIVAGNAAGSLAFQDAAGAKTILAALQARSEIIEARLLDVSGLELARFVHGERKGLPFDHLGDARLVVRGTRILISEPVVFGRDHLGRLELSADIRDTLRSLGLVGGAVLVVVISGAMLIAYFLTRRIQYAITAPLFALANTAHAVAAKNDYTVRAIRAGNDEIGHLTEAFNHMLAEVHHRDLALRDAQHQLSEQISTLQREMADRQRAEAELARTHQDLIEASRRAGQAEVASSVLHNVGNVLNSVIVSSTLIIERLRASKAANVMLTAALLEENRASLGAFFHEQPKGKLLLNYLPQLGRDLEAERTLILSETQALARNIEHIKEIIATQQAHSRSTRVDEILDVSEVTEHALTLAFESIGAQRIQVERSYGSVPSFYSDKHRVLQILVNLLRNAAQAAQGNQGNLPKLRIATEADQDTVRISVSDNGVGIAEENLTRIFQHGFTTRRDGHGFGLHSGALAARQMRGRLQAKSAGLGQGATFTLELPLQLTPP